MNYLPSYVEAANADLGPNQWYLLFLLTLLSIVAAFMGKLFLKGNQQAFNPSQHNWQMQHIFFAFDL